MRYIIVLKSILCSLHCFSQINIWEGALYHKKVMLTPYVVDGSNNPAVIVCPGGSYFWHDIDTEGHEVAQWLYKNGVSAFVLNYRTASVPAFIFRYRYVFRGNRYPDPQDDLKRCIQLLKERKQEFGINSDKIGAMGFSAGGHLVMSAAELFEDTDKPAFVASIYPVVTMTHNCVHKRSRRGLLGDDKKNNKSLRRLLSLEENVPANCPPVFLVNCKDDPIVDYRNSVLLDSALTEKNIPHKYIQFSTGGHGFGASETKGTEECRKWKSEFLNWLVAIIK